MLRRTSSLVALTGTVLATLVLAAPAAHAGPGESQFVSLTNQARANAGRRGYAVAGDLVAVARRQAQRMAARGTIYHNPNLGGEVSGWRAVGENVGMGGSVSSIHNAFMGSASHRSNILDTDFTQVGIGTATDGKGVLYVAEVFRLPMGGTTAAPRPAPARTVTAARPRTTSTVRAPARPAATRPAARPAPSSTLAARLRRAAALARPAAERGAIGRAVVYVEVMGALG